MSEAKYVPILCLDFDGVIHSYTSGWKGADVIPDAIVPGAIDFIMEAQAHGWKVAIFSSRTNQPGGLAAMQDYMKDRYGECCRAGRDEDVEMWWASYEDIDWPTEKPPAVITIDDRAVTFTGTWPTMDFLKNFKPWNKKG